MPALQSNLAPVIDKREAKSSMEDSLGPFATDDEQLSQLQVCSRQLRSLCALTHQAEDIPKVGGRTDISPGVKAEDATGK